jgi:GntR family transcriptional regulator
VNTPLHARIAADLRARILAGELAVGEPIPSEAELQAQWHGSRAPVRQALSALRAEGLIAGGRGKSPVVQRQQLSQPFDSLLSFTRWVHLMGRVPGQRTVEIARRPADAVVAGYLRIAPGENVVQLRRLRLLDDDPVMVERTTFPLRYGARLFDHDPDAGSIYEFLISGGLRVGVARHIIDAVPADQDDCALLGIALGAPLLREQRIARTADGDIFEYSDDRYVPGRVTFTIDNSPTGHSALGRMSPDDTSGISNHQLVKE